MGSRAVEQFCVFRWSAGCLAVLLCAGSYTHGNAAPPPRDRSDVQRVLAVSADDLPESVSARPLTVVLLADQKDHGAGEHDYPRWQARWSLLLGGAAASDVAAANLHGPDAHDDKAKEGSPNVCVARAWQWPDSDQWKSADLVVAFCYLNWNPERLTQVRKYLTRGGGLVLVHSATWTKPQPSREVAEVVGVGGFQQWRHGAIELELMKPEDPICRGLPRKIELEDESYWPPSPAMETGQLEVLAASREKSESDGPASPQPMFWTWRLGAGRVFGCVPGHFNWTFDDPYFRLLLLRGMAWAAGESPFRFDHLATRASRQSAAAELPANGESVRITNMLALNEDNSHFFGTRKPEDMTRAGLQAFVDQYAGSTVTHLFLCPNAMRASFRSQTRDAIWDPVQGKEPGDIWPQNAKRLFEAGLDPYAVWIARCRENRVSPWLSMRMNDVHSVDDPDNFMHSTFWREHPDCWRVPHGSASSWLNRALNYARPEVREHQMAFVRELLERYDSDGLELDWMRFGYHLTPGKEREERGVLDEFVRQTHVLVREWSQKRGHPIRLGVRVPAHPDAAAGLGMDAVEWAREGWVDLVVPCPFWTSSDFDIPVELWQERLGTAARRVAIAPGIEYQSRPWPGGTAVANDLPALRGFAAAAWHRGAENLYLFNWMDSETRPVTETEYSRLLREGLSHATVANAPRRHIVCYRDTVPAGFPDGAQLPAGAQKGKVFRVPLGAKPAAGCVFAIVGLAARDGLTAATFEASLNGTQMDGQAEITDRQNLGGSPARAIGFSFPFAAMKDGDNELLVRQTDAAAAQEIVWFEVRIEPARMPFPVK
jgi:type 1 glutamine amidotransferase